MEGAIDNLRNEGAGQSSHVPQGHATVTSCQDCGKTVSLLAEMCPHCARPKPQYSASQLAGLVAAEEQATQKAASAKESEDMWGCIGLGWLINLVIATVAMGAKGFFGALFLGPLIWLMR